MLTGKNIILGITGGIAAYKSAGWIREMKKEGAEVTVVMTKSAAEFISPLTCSALSGNEVKSDIFARESSHEIPHINLACEADLILIAPATANTISRIAHGMADDLLSTIVLAATCPLIICPAMNSNMYRHPATRDNIKTLKRRGAIVVDPDEGSLACRASGPGRLPEYLEAREFVLAALADQDLAGTRVMVTAGPTLEPLDEVRFLGNRSSGRMGYALAAAAHRRGAAVTLISGPTSLAPPAGIETVQVTTALEMHEAVMERWQASEVIVKAAAVSDFRPKAKAAGKIKKAASGLSLDLAENPDILKELGQKKGKKDNPVLVGFAAESGDGLAEGMRKLKTKNCDLMVVNDISEADAGFAVDTNRVVILDHDGGEERLPLMKKEEIAGRIWDRVVRIRRGA